MPSSKGVKERDGLSYACEWVGQFFYHFSRMERELDSCIGKVFELKIGPTSILTAKMSVAAKITIVSAMIESQMSGPKRTQLQKLLNKIWAINDDRVVIAHSTFTAAENNSVKFERLSLNKDGYELKTPIWTKSDFDRRFKHMEKWSTTLGNLVEQLEPYVPSLDFSDPRNSMYAALLF